MYEISPLWAAGPAISAAAASVTKDTVNGGIQSEIKIIFSADSNQGGLQKVLLYLKFFPR